MVAVAGSLLLVACANGGDSGSGAGTPAEGKAAVSVGTVGVQDDGGKPVHGGTLTYAPFSPVASVDPVQMYVSGSTGGSEAAAIYDVLVRYDAANNKYEPQLARSVRASEDEKTWTVTLRDGVTFSDGTPVNADAVQWSTNRWVAEHGLNSQLFQESVARTTSPDPTTVVFTLKQPWSEFPSLLSMGAGMIVAPSSMNTGKFTPIGAGPFVVEQFAAENELLLKARPDYWGGAPNLDQLRFVNVTGDRAKADTLKAGGIQMAFLRDPQTIDQVRAAGTPGFMETDLLGDVGLINNRPGRPGADVRVRQAMAYAINPKVIDQRVNAGKGRPSADIFPPGSRWHSDGVTGLGFDPAKAKQLLDAAKADGYDGKLSYLGFTEPKAQDEALAVQAMLQAVGFTVTIDYVNNATEITQKTYIDHDFDLARGASSVWEAAPYPRLASNLASASTSNALGSKDPAMDAALSKVKTTTTEAAKRAALADLQKEVNAQVPFLTWASLTAFVPWQKNVHGVKPSLDAIMLFDKAWVQS